MLYSGRVRSSRRPAHIVYTYHMGGLVFHRTCGDMDGQTEKMVRRRGFSLPPYRDILARAFSSLVQLHKPRFAIPRVTRTVGT